MSRLQNKVAIVFGAGPNIGGTVAYFLAREDAAVMVCDVNFVAAEKTVAFIRSKGGRAEALACDALDENSVASSVKNALDRFGRLDIAFNMAGHIHWSSITEMDTESWTRAVSSYPTAGMLTTKHCARAMIEQKRAGSIIHLLSTAAHFGSAGAACYTAAKAGLLNLARSAAMDLAYANIRVNTITPCGMEHNLWTNRRNELDPHFRPPESRSYYSREDYLKSIPLQRFPRASDIAWAAVFLASDESSFITAADIPVDGGLRYKYPTWRPGDFAHATLKDYVKDLDITEYGEPVRKVLGS